jgi:hypothetical protein
MPSLERLSKQYYEITDKLINCDFGKGAKLQSVELQNEVYRTVVCELETILEDFHRAGIWRRDCNEVVRIYRGEVR